MDICKVTAVHCGVFADLESVGGAGGPHNTEPPIGACGIPPTKILKRDLAPGPHTANGPTSEPSAAVPPPPQHQQQQPLSMAIPQLQQQPVQQQQQQQQQIPQQQTQSSAMQQQQQQQHSGALAGPALPQGPLGMTLQQVRNLRLYPRGLIHAFKHTSECKLFWCSWDHAVSIHNESIGTAVQHVACSLVST